MKRKSRCKLSEKKTVWLKCSWGKLEKNNDKHKDNTLTPLLNSIHTHTQKK
jgi:hypothetical protein